MYYQEMIDRVMADLGVKRRRAAGYVAMFAEKYAGCKEAVTSVRASYTDGGRVEVAYVVNGKEASVVLGTESPYSKEVKARNMRRKQNKETI